MSFFPLTVDFEEKIYAAGRIPGSFFRREARASTEGILTARVTDRSIRPLFPKGMRNEVQVITTAISSDSVHHLDLLSLNAASAALHISDVPWARPGGRRARRLHRRAARCQRHDSGNGSQRARPARCRHPRRHPHG